MLVTKEHVTSVSGPDGEITADKNGVLDVPEDLGDWLIRVHGFERHIDPPTKAEKAAAEAKTEPKPETAAAKKKREAAEAKAAAEAKTDDDVPDKQSEDSSDQ